MMRNSLFISGTGTGVGKTIVTASLIRALAERRIAVRASKPFATGVPSKDWKDDDPGFLDRTLERYGMEPLQPGERLCWPLAPRAAAELEGRVIGYHDLVEHHRSLVLPHNSIAVIEGVGGAAVPINKAALLSDFAAEVGAPVLIVSRTDLGTINHTLLTVEHFRNRKCNIHGLIFVRHSDGPLGLDEQTSPDMIVDITGLRAFGTVPWNGALAQAATADEAFDLLPWECEAIQELANSLIIS